VAACSSSSDPPAGTTGCTSKAVTVGQQPVTCGGATIMAKEANDYSFDPTKTAFADWTRVTLYRSGVLV